MGKALDFDAALAAWDEANGCLHRGPFHPEFSRRAAEQRVAEAYADLVESARELGRREARDALARGAK